MTSWIVSVCGIALLSVLVDVILPDGKTQKYVQAVVGVVLTFAMLSPISRFFASKEASNLSSNGNFDTNITIQQAYLDGIHSQNNLARVQRVENVISNLGIKNAAVTMQPNGYVLAKVKCNKQTLAELQQALAVSESKIIILWSKTDG